MVEEDVGNGCHAHGGAGMTGVRFEGGIDLRGINIKISNGSMTSNEDMAALKSFLASCVVKVFCPALSTTYGEKADGVDG